MTETTILPYVHDPAYDTHFLAIYGNWMLFLNKDQRYLGRSYAWWVGGHVDRMDISQLPIADMYDLFHGVTRAFSAAVAEAWGATHVNYSWLGNEVDKHGGHGHLHLVPRYFKRSPIIGSETFPDLHIKKNWALEGGPRLVTGLVLPQILTLLRNALVFDDPSKVRSLDEFVPPAR